VICKIPRTEIFQYLDAELAPADRTRVETHVASCSDCAQLVRIERAFRTAYMDRLTPDPAPDSVREGVSRLLAALPDPGSVRRASRRLTPAAMLAGGVGLLVLGAFLGAGVRDVWRGPGLSIVQLADASVDHHQKLVRGLLPLDIKAASARDAEAWFKSKLDFNVSIPEVKDHRVTLLGGRISHLRELEAAALGYRVDDKPVSLFIIPEEQYRRLGLSETPKFKVLSRRGYDVIVWRSHGAGYTLVSEIGGQPCLVCHSTKEPLELAPGSPAHQS
jgi:anti-sigma factor RsiW